MSTGTRPLNAFITVTGEQAIETARFLDRSCGTAGIAVPCTAFLSHSRICTRRRGPDTNGSKLFENNVPDEDATVVKKLRAAGAINVGN